jgi:hypothetical protein
MAASTAAAWGGHVPLAGAREATVIVVLPMWAVPVMGAQPVDPLMWPALSIVR